MPASGRCTDSSGYWAGRRSSKLEGEKCVDIAVGDGLTECIFQLGFFHSVEQVAERYGRLREAGTELVVIVADNDDAGIKRAHQSAQAAARVGLAAMVLNAQDIWPDIPAKGSHDDAPGTGQDRFVPLLDMIKGRRAAGLLAPVVGTPGLEGRIWALPYAGIGCAWCGSSPFWEDMYEVAQGFHRDDHPLHRRQASIRAFAHRAGASLTPHQIKWIDKQAE